MRTWELKTEDGRTSGFEISNALITRRGVVRTIERIPGAVITKAPRPWSLEGRDDDFCHFTISGTRFVAWEPFGDNSRFWIQVEDESAFPHVETVRRAFAARRLFGAFGV